MNGRSRREEDSYYPADLLQRVSEAANRFLVPPLQAAVPDDLDVTYATKRILVMSQPKDDAHSDHGAAAAGDDSQCRPQEEEGLEEEDLEDGNSSLESSNVSYHQHHLPLPTPQDPIAVTSNYENTSLNYRQYHHQSNGYSHNIHSHSSVYIGRYLNEKHNQRYIVFNLTDVPSSSKVCAGLSYQIVDLYWKNACSYTYSSSYSYDSTNQNHHCCRNVPSLPHVLELCYAMMAYLSLSEDRVVVLYCKNGKTRSGVLTACYLKYSRMVQSSLQGFEMFCSKRYSPSFILQNHTDWKKHHNYDHPPIPPSLETFFRNFDMLMDMGTWPHRESYATILTSQSIQVPLPGRLMCKGIGMEGIPVVHVPQIRIFNCGILIYNSHSSNEEWSIDDDENNDSLTSRYVLVVL